MSENKKIKNATPLTYNGIQFKSKLEVMCYKTLKDYGFKPLYEGKRYVLWEGFKPTVAFYNRSKKNKQLVLDASKIRDITYTPDFTFKAGNTFIIIELKGIENDVYPIKKKLFRKLLEGTKDTMYFEIRTKKELVTAINIIKARCLDNNG